MDSGNTLANVLSILAIVISIVVPLLTRNRELTSEKKNHEFELFQDVYQEHLVRKIPPAKLELHISQEGELTGIDDLIDELCSIRKDSLYFEYSDNEFFLKLKNNLQDLEDYLILSEGTPLKEELAEDFLFNVQVKLNEIYKTILEKF